MNMNMNMNNDGLYFKAEKLCYKTVMCLGHVITPIDLILTMLGGNSPRDAALSCNMLFLIVRLAESITCMGRCCCMERIPCLCCSQPIHIPRPCAPTASTFN